MKTFILSISRLFMQPHPRVGQITYFKEKITNGTKIHTIRTKSDHWKHCISQVRSEQGFISLRQWRAEPYRSKSDEFLKLYECDFEMIDKINGKWFINKSTNEVNVLQLCLNDGLTIDDFNGWFPEANYTNLIIIHFTDFRYSTEIIKKYSTGINQSFINQQLKLSIFDDLKINPINTKPFGFDKTY